MSETGLPKTLDKDEKTWAAIAHLSALLAYVVPMGNIAGPLVVWLIKKDESPFVAEHALAALNFQLVMSFAMLIATGLSCFLVGVPLVLALGVISLVFTVQGAMAAADGAPYDYPITWKMV